MHSLEARLVVQGWAADTPRALDKIIRNQGLRVGMIEGVRASLVADRVPDRATDLAVQVHFIDPPHPLALPSIELIAERVAPALRWRPGTAVPTLQSAFPERVSAQ